jgi:hypothetical protein
MKQLKTKFKEGSELQSELMRELVVWRRRVRVSEPRRGARVSPVRVSEFSE